MQIKSHEPLTRYVELRIAPSLCYTQHRAQEQRVGVGGVGVAGGYLHRNSTEHVEAKTRWPQFCRHFRMDFVDDIHGIFAIYGH